MKAFINKYIKPSQDGEINDKLIFLQPLRDALTNLNKKNKWIIPGLAIGLGLLLLIVIIISIQNQSTVVSKLASSENKRTITILNALSDTNAQLQQLSNTPQNSASFKTALSNITSDLSTIQKTANELAKSSEVEKVSSQLSSMQNDVDTQMLDIKKAVASSSDAKQYLDQKVLPFQVISIDVISQQPFVSINYANHITPMAVGDTVAGWKITAANYDVSQVEFKNTHDQYIKIALQG